MSISGINSFWSSLTGVSDEDYIPNLQPITLTVEELSSPLSETRENPELVSIELQRIEQEKNAALFQKNQLDLSNSIRSVFASIHTNLITKYPVEMQSVGNDITRCYGYYKKIELSEGTKIVLHADFHGNLEAVQCFSNFVKQNRQSSGAPVKPI
ncbi:MAG: hypothetical protein WCP39_03245, partial [Chlamydiota bacterium]